VNDLSFFERPSSIAAQQGESLVNIPSRSCRPTIVACLFATVLSLCPVHPIFGKQPLDEIYISDLSQCLPASALVKTRQQSKWQLIDYQTDTVNGTMVVAGSYIDAPQLTLPLRAKGWHAVYVGYWNPEFAYDGTPVFKLKLTGEPAFRQFHSGASPDSQEATFLREVYVRTDDLTNKDLVIAKPNGPLGKSAYLAYVKLIPLTPDQEKQIKQDRLRTDTRNLVATIDGASYFHFSEYAHPEHVLEQIELYRDSDVAKVLWAVNYGSATNYPTQVDGAIFQGSDHNRARFVNGNGANNYIRGEKQNYESLKAFAAQGIIPQQIAADHAHAMGLKFDLMFRLGILGSVGPLRMDEQNYLARHPQFRQILRDGTLLEKASYAFDDVQAFMLSLVREATQKIDADGINLCFVRGPHFLRYEKPVLDAFHAKHSLDAHDVEPTDPRLLQVRGEIMTRFIRKVRQALDEISKAKGRKLDLSVWVWPSDQNVWLGKTPLEEGLDVKQWIREGLLDSVICQEGIDADYIKLGKETGCRFVLFTGYRGEKAMSPESVTKAYAAGVNTFAFWDIDAAQIRPATWNWLRRIGHRNEMADWPRFDPGSRLIQLKTVAGVDVEKGLAGSVYSGG